MYLALCLTGGEGGCLPCLGHISDRWSPDLSLLELPCNALDFECLLLLRVDFEDRPKPVDIVAIVPVPLSSDCSTCYERKKEIKTESCMELFASLWLVGTLHVRTIYFKQSQVSLQICPGLNANEIHIPRGKHHKVSLVKSHQNTQFCQIQSNMRMSNNPAKYEVLIKQYLHSILDIQLEA